MISPVSEMSPAISKIDFGNDWVKNRLQILMEDSKIAPDQKVELRNATLKLVDWVGPYNVAMFLGGWGWECLIEVINWNVNALTQISNYQGGRDLIEKLKKGHSSDASPIIEAAWRFFSNGAGIQIEPTNDLNGVMKKPDLAVLNSQGHRICWLELASLGEGEDEQKSRLFNQKISDLLFYNHHSRHVSGKFSRVMSDIEMGQFEMDLRQAVERLEQSGQCQLIQIPGIYRILISTDVDDAKHQESCTQHGIKAGTTEYPGFDMRESVRLNRLIRKEMKHFGPVEPVVLELTTHPYNVIRNKNIRFRELQSELKWTISQYPQLLAVVVQLKSFGPFQPKTWHCLGDVSIEGSMHSLEGFDNYVYFNPLYSLNNGSSLRALIIDAYQSIG